MDVGHSSPPQSPSPFNFSPGTPQTTNWVSVLTPPDMIEGDASKHMSPASFDTPSPNQVEGFPIPDMREVINSNVWDAALDDDVAVGDVSVDNVVDTATDKAMHDNATND